MLYDGVCDGVNPRRCYFFFSFLEGIIYILPPCPGFLLDLIGGPLVYNDLPFIIYLLLYFFTCINTHTHTPILSLSLSVFSIFFLCKFSSNIIMTLYYIRWNVYYVCIIISYPRDISYCIILTCLRDWRTDKINKITILVWFIFYKGLNSRRKQKMYKVNLVNLFYAY